MKCQDFLDNEQKLIFQHFWSETWDEKKMMVQCLVDVISPLDTRHRKNPEKSRKGNTLQYHLEQGGLRKRVCKAMFLNTLGLSGWSVVQWVVGGKIRKSVEPRKKKCSIKARSCKKEISSSIFRLVAKS